MNTTARLQGSRRVQVPPSIARAQGEPEGEAILKHLADFLDAFMWQADPATLRITFITKSVRDVLGHPTSRWLGEPAVWCENIHADDRERVLEGLRAAATDGLDHEVEFRALASDGSTPTLRHTVRLLTPPSGKAEMWGVTTHVSPETDGRPEALRDAEERYRVLSAQTAKFRRQALTDGLTQLPNRILFQDRLAATLRSAQRSGEPVAVLLMDLDRFKEINDTRGHQAGDAVLKDVALRVRVCLRAQDTPARLGGDEFAAVLPNTDREGATRVAERIVRALQTQIATDSSPCAVGASIGIAFSPLHGTDPDHVLARADVAMYRAKAAGGGYALASADDEMPRGTGLGVRGRRGRHIRSKVVGLAVALALMTGATGFAAHHAQSRDSASRIDAAVVELRNASSGDVLDAVSGAEQTLADISLKDVAGIDVLSALHRLEQLLNVMQPGVAGATGDRVHQLIAAVHTAELVGGPRSGSATDGSVAGSTGATSPAVPVAVPTL